MNARWWHPSTWTVRTRILLTILGVAAFGMIATGAVTFLEQREQVLERIDRRLAATADDVQYVASSVAESRATENSNNSPRTLVNQVLRMSLQRIIPDHNESVLGVIGGKAALTSGASAAFAIHDDKAFVARVVAETQSGETMRGTARTSLGTLRYVAIPVRDSTSTERGVFVAAYNLDAEMATIIHSVRIFSFAAIGTLVIVALVGAVVAGRLLRPIRQLQRTAATITTVDLSQRIPIRGTDDISNMAQTVNHMLDRISRGMDAQRQLLDDVRHELRTPVTIVRGHLELMDAHDANDVRQTRDLVIDELDRMNTLVSDIALLSEASSNSDSGFASHDLESFAQMVFDKAQALATDRVWRAEFSAAGRAVFDADRITQAWLQLAENAVKYSQPGTEITLGTRMVDADGAVDASKSAHTVSTPQWQLFVRDRGVGIEPAMRDKVFDRFRRVGTTRGVEGSGLGLAIVQAIANVHGGVAAIAAGQDGKPAAPASAPGTTVTVTLPFERNDAAAATQGDDSAQQEDA